MLHGTTVATNAVLTGDGVKVGLLVTDGYRQILHLARSWVPGGLGAWILFNKSRPMAPLKWTVEVTERIDADGSVVTPLDETAVSAVAQGFRDAGVEAITVAFINAYVNAEHEIKARELLEAQLPDVAISISSETVPELQEYERTITTVANSFVKPIVARYIFNLKSKLAARTGDIK